MIGPAGHAVEPIVVNLGHVTHLAHDCLPYLLALFQQRQVGETERPNTRLRLPDSGTVTDFLRAWGLPDALVEITGFRFEDLLHEHSRRRFRALPPFSRYEQVIDRPDGGQETLLPTSFFSLTVIRPPALGLLPGLASTPERIAAYERERWLQDRVRSVLDYYLDGDGDLVGSKAVHEAVLNAASHPKATIGYVSSQLIRGIPRGRKRGPVEALEVAIWDNGQTYSETLRGRIAQGLDVRSSSFGSKYESFDVEIPRDDGLPPDTLTLVSQMGEFDAEYQRHVTDEVLSVAAFMLGVSSEPDATRFDPLTGEVRNDPAGSGLHDIRDVVIDQFGGEVFYRTSRLGVTIKRKGSLGSYSVEVLLAGRDEPPIAGNTLLFRIPLVAATGSLGIRRA